MLRILLIFTCLLSFMSSNAQTARTVTVHEEESSLYLKYLDGKPVTLEIDGITIPKSAYSRYQNLIDHYLAERIPDIAETQTEETEPLQTTNNDRLALAFETALSKEDIPFDANDYKLKLTNTKLIINGDIMEDKMRTDLTKIAYGMKRLEKSDKFSIKISKSKNSKSISISSEGN